MSDPRTTLLAAAGLGAGVVLGLWLGASPERTARPDARPTPASVPQASRAAALEARTALAPEATPVSAPSAPQTAREYLAAYHGARWPEVEADIEASGQVDLDQPYSQRPWEEVEASFAELVGVKPSNRESLCRSLLHWPESLDAAYVREHFGLNAVGVELSEADLLAIADLAAPANEEIARRAEHYADLLDLYVRERWNTGRYQRAPFTTASAHPLLGFHSQSHAGWGWAITITLERADYPDLEALEDEILRLCWQRDFALTEHLRARFLR